MQYLTDYIDRYMWNCKCEQQNSFLLKNIMWIKLGSDMQDKYIYYWNIINIINRPRSFRKIRHYDVTKMSNAWERRVRDTFGLSPSEAAIFSTQRALFCLTGTGTFCTVPEDSNFYIRRSIVDMLGRLFRT